MARESGLTYCNSRAAAAAASNAPRDSELSWNINGWRWHHLYDSCERRAKPCPPHTIDAGWRAVSQVCACNAGHYLPRWCFLPAGLPPEMFRSATVCSALRTNYRCRQQRFEILVPQHEHSHSPSCPQLKRCFWSTDKLYRWLRYLPCQRVQ